MRKFRGGEVDDLTVLEVDDAPGAGHDGGDVAGDDVLAVAQAEDERRALACGHHFAREVDARRDAALGAFGVEEGLAQGGEEPAFAGDGGLLGVMVGDEIAEALGVGLGLERVALGEEEFLYRSIIFDDAVVEQGDFLVAPDVRVGVGVADAAMGRPAGMADAAGAGERGPRDLFLEVGDSADFFRDCEGAALEDGDAGGVIAAIFQAFEAFEDEGSRFLSTDVADDSAHDGRER